MSHEQTDQVSDRKLLREFVREGSETAFREIVERYAGMVTGTCRRQLRQPEGVEEVVQNVFAVMARKAPQLLRYRYLGGWLSKAAVFESKCWQRSEACRRKQLKQYIMEQENDDAVSGLSDDYLQYLDEALATLKKSDRDVMVMRFFEGKRFTEIARGIGKNADAVRKQVDRNLLKLRGHLSARGIVIPVATVAACLKAGACSSMVGKASVAAIVNFALQRGVSSALTTPVVKTAASVGKTAKLMLILLISGIVIPWSGWGFERIRNTQHAALAKDQEGARSAHRQRISVSNADRTERLLAELRAMDAVTDDVRRARMLFEFLLALRREDFPLVVTEVPDVITTGDYYYLLKRWYQIDPEQSIDSIVSGKVRSHNEEHLPEGLVPGENPAIQCHRFNPWMRDHARWWGQDNLIEASDKYAQLRKDWQKQLGREDIADMGERDCRPEGGFSALQVDIAIGLAQCHGHLAKLAFERGLPVTGLTMLEGAPRHMRQDILIDGFFAAMLPKAHALYRGRKSHASVLLQQAEIDHAFAQASHGIETIRHGELRLAAVRAAAILLGELNEDRARNWSAKRLVGER